MLTPRDYQEDAVQSFFDYYNAGNKGNPIIVAATGAGKSLILAELIRKIMTGFAGQRVIMATHVANLVLQNAQKIIAQYPNCNLGIYSAGLGKKQPWADVIYGGIQSMYKYPEKFGKRDLLFIDECHLLSPQADGMYTKFIEGLKKQNPYLKIVGLSATPWRQKGGSLINQEDAIFTDIIYDISLGYLIKRGYLTGLVGKSSIIQADLSGVKKIGGEFNLAQLEKAFDKEELTDAALDEVEQLAFDRKYFLFFCSGLDHCEHVAANLTARGWECYTITGSTTQKRREFLFNKFRKSHTRIALINNTVLTTGTDLPNADCLVFLRGTQSSALFIQICGRLARPIYADGYDLLTDAGRLAAIANGSKPSSLILDYGGNIQRFGAVDLIEAPRSKSGIKSDEPTSPPQKICPNCRESLHVTVRECHCGHIFDAPDRINHETSATTLAIMSTEMASTKHKIVKTEYKSHVAKSGVPCLRVQYYDAMGFLASDYIPFSQFGNIRKLADEWFCEVTDEEHHGKLPRNTEEALAVKHLYNSPSFIHLRKKGKYSEIIKREYPKKKASTNVITEQQAVKIIDLYFNKGMRPYHIEKHMFNFSDKLAIDNMASAISRITNGDSYKNLKRPDISKEIARNRQRRRTLDETIVVDGITGCHVTNRCNVTINGKSVSASKYIYESSEGPVRDGKVVITSCKNSKCINVQHMELSDNNGANTKKITLWRVSEEPIIFNSIASANRLVGGARTGISDAARRGKTTYKGYNFKIEE